MSGLRTLGCDRALARALWRDHARAGNLARVRRLIACCVVVGLAMSAACSSGSSSPRLLGTIHTRIGDARAYCGGKYTHTCSGEAALVFASCSKAYEAATTHLIDVPRSLRATIQRIAGTDPPGRRHWTDIRCGAQIMPPSDATICSGRQVIQVEGKPAHPPKGWETMSPEQLRNLGWRVVSTPSAGNCPSP